MSAIVSNLNVDPIHALELVTEHLGDLESVLSIAELLPSEIVEFRKARDEWLKKSKTLLLTLFDVEFGWARNATAQIALGELQEVQRYFSALKTEIAFFLEESAKRSQGSGGWEVGKDLQDGVSIEAAVERLEKYIGEGRQLLEHSDTIGTAGDQDRRFEEAQRWLERGSIVLRRLFRSGDRRAARYEIGPNLEHPLEALSYFEDLSKRLELEVDLAVPNGDQGESGMVGIESSIVRLRRICDRFHRAVLQLRDRRAGKAPLVMDDEYDVQYLLGALLSIDFDDVRPEEYSPSRAGASSRVDFLLKNERILVETKRTRKGLADKGIGEELAVDIERYRGHPDLDVLFCFVYDPEHRIRNPTGIQGDLGREESGLSVEVSIRPTA